MSGGAPFSSLVGCVCLATRFLFTLNSLFTSPTSWGKPHVPAGVDATENRELVSELVYEAVPQVSTGSLVYSEKQKTNSLLERLVRLQRVQSQHGRDKVLLHE